MNQTEKRCIDYWLDTTSYRFAGDFEGMYRGIDDPWGCKKAANSIQRRMLLTLLFGEGRCYAKILDVGCGLGAFTAHLQQTNDGGEVVGCDVSATAVAKASAEHPQLRFVRLDLASEPLQETADLVVMSEVMWYVLAQLPEVMRKILAALRPGGHFCVQQCFHRLQNYGTELLRSPEEFIVRYFQPAGLEPIHEWHKCCPTKLC